MNLQFDKTYVRRWSHAVAIVAGNAALESARVIKTATTLSKLGFRVYFFGLSDTDQDQTPTGYPFAVKLAANPACQGLAQQDWYNGLGQKEMSLLIQRLSENIVKLMGFQKFDVLHTHDIFGLAIGARLKKKPMGPSVKWVHDLGTVGENPRNNSKARLMMRTLERESTRHPDALITASPLLVNLLMDQYGVPAPELILNAPRWADFDPWYANPIRKALQLDVHSPLLVYHGSVQPSQRIDMMIEALALMPEAHLSLVSESSGTYLNHLWDCAARNNAAQRLHVHPRVPEQETTSFLRDVNAGISPLPWGENANLALPTTLFDYIHSGTPVVCQDSQAVSGFLENHDCGRTFTESDGHGLVRAIRQVIATYPKGLPTPADGSELALRYSWEAQEQVLAKVYERLLNLNNQPVKKNRRRQVEPIVHLPRPSSNQPFTLAEALQKSGVNAQSANITGNGFGYRYHQAIDKHQHALSAIDAYFNHQKMAQYQTYHFHARPLIYRGDFSFPTGWDLVMLKAMGKSVFFHFRGSEVRLNSIFKVLSPYNYVDELSMDDAPGMPFAFDEREQTAFRDFVCGVCDAVFVNDPELQCYVPNALIVPRAIDSEWLKTKPSVMQRERPLIVHAPSRRGVKGSEFVLEAIEQLKKERYVFEFKLVENLSHKEAMEIYRDATIIVDQLRIGWYGVLAVEGMALGKAVVSYIRSDLRHYLPRQSPLACANPDNLTDVLRYLLDTPEAVVRYGKAGQKFVQEYHSALNIAQLLMFVYRYPLQMIDPVAVSSYLDRQIMSAIPKFMLARSTQLRQAGDLTGSETLLQHVLEENTGHIGALTALAEVATARRDWDQAIRRWERVLAVCSVGNWSAPGQAVARLAAAHRTKVAAMRRAGDLDGAEKLLMGALAKPDKDIFFLTQLAEIATARKDWAEAVKRWERVLSVCEQNFESVPKQAGARLAAARRIQVAAMRRAGDLDGAEKLLMGALAKHDKDIFFLTQLAEIATARKDWAEAVKRWERVLSVCEQNFESVPNQAGARLAAARLYHTGMRGKLAYYLRLCFSHARNKGWEPTARKAVAKLDRLTKSHFGKR